MKSELPDFKKDRDAAPAPGCVVYRWEVSDAVTAFLSLVPSPNEDGFTVDVGWSADGTYPVYPTAGPDEISQNGDSRFRLGHLFGSREDFWWYLARRSSIDDDFFTFQEDPLETAIARVEPAIDDTFEKIKAYAIPYFEAKGRG